MLGSGFKLTFHCSAHILIFTKSFFNSFAVVFALCTTENNEVLSANSLAFDDRPTARSFIYIKKVVGLVWNLEELLR